MKKIKPSKTWRSHMNTFQLTIHIAGPTRKDVLVGLSAMVEHANIHHSEKHDPSYVSVGILGTDGNYYDCSFDITEKELK